MLRRTDSPPTATPLLLLLAGLLLPRSATAAWTPGKATHYGPYPSAPQYADAGYLANEQGIGCSTGIPGNDPRWNAIVAAGVYPVPPPFTTTIYPKQATVAVSRAAYPSKVTANSMCYRTLQLRSRTNSSLPTISAIAVDFCPYGTCNWPAKELANNVDIYGEYTWKALGGQDGGGTIDLDILWPADVKPWGPWDADDPDLPSGVTPGPASAGAGSDGSGGGGGANSATSTGVPLGDGDGSGGLGTGAIAAIVVACIAGAAAVSFGAWWYARRRAHFAAKKAMASKSASEKPIAQWAT
ncbi:hypothetical protein HDU87_004357 [Geranomyces variabilis]|uniref:Uncharacterized protein n=1 Tax=Geranomyces variabilis TaxID=109894 RepID=A0AAD5TK77_9FUNG|nr:hypothetical protein HDU87_004357 [Geranomyces variabilis]